MFPSYMSDRGLAVRIPQVRSKLNGETAVDENSINNQGKKEKKEFFSSQTGDHNLGSRLSEDLRTVLPVRCRRHSPKQFSRQRIVNQNDLLILHKVHEDTKPRCKSP